MTSSRYSLELTILQLFFPWDILCIENKETRPRGTGSELHPEGMAQGSGRKAQGIRQKQAKKLIFSLCLGPYVLRLMP